MVALWRQASDHTKNEDLGEEEISYIRIILNVIGLKTCDQKALEYLQWNL